MTKFKISVDGKEIGIGESCDLEYQEVGIKQRYFLSIGGDIHSDITDYKQYSEFLEGRLKLATEMSVGKYSVRILKVDHLLPRFKKLSCDSLSMFADRSSIWNCFNENIRKKIIKYDFVILSHLGEQIVLKSRLSLV
jgi:hypothetical protein